MDTEPEVLQSEADDESQTVRRSLTRTVAKLVREGARAEAKDDDKELPAAAEADVEELKQKIQGYFKACDDDAVAVRDKSGKPTGETKSKPYTLAGLVLALGLNSKAELRRYEKTPGFAEVLSRALLQMEDQVNIELRERTSNPAGLIFDLKNTFKWSDNPDTRRVGLDLSFTEALEEIAGTSRGLPKERMLNLHYEKEKIRNERKPKHSRRKRKR